MKKIALFLFMLVIMSLPKLTSLKAQPLKVEPSFSKPFGLQAIALKNFGKTSDFIGGFTHGGVDYYVYGTFPNIDYVEADLPYSFYAEGYCYFYDNSQRISIDITWTEGSFHHDGPLWL